MLIDQNNRLFLFVAVSWLLLLRGEFEISGIGQKAFC
jgi:hypothetical protein